MIIKIIFNKDELLTDLHRELHFKANILESATQSSNLEDMMDGVRKKMMTEFINKSFGLLLVKTSAYHTESESFNYFLELEINDYPKKTVQSLIDCAHDFIIANTLVYWYKNTLPEYVETQEREVEELTSRLKILLCQRDTPIRMGRHYF